MAIIKSSLLSEIRGSVGGTTYARNKAGLYARNRSKPVNPNTVNQSLVRSQFGINSFNFGALTVDQVAAWNQFAQGYPAVNRVGDTYTPSGRQMYMLCNQNLASIGEAPIDTPPYDIPVVPSCNTAESDFNMATDAGPPIVMLTMVLRDTTSDLATAIIVYQITPNMQPARQSYRNRMRQIGFALQGTNPSLGAAWNAYFGNPTVAPGQIVNARVAAVDPASGVSSAWFYFQGIVPEPAP